MQVQKAIQLFLEKNNLTKTLQSFKRQSKRTNNIANNSHNSKIGHTQLLGIQKFTLNRTNSYQIRQHFQKTDQKTLRKTINKIKRNKNQLVTTNQSNTNLQRITHLPFFKKLVQKENKVKNQQQEDMEESLSQLRQSRSYINTLEESRQYDDNQWDSQKDVGFDLFQCLPEQLQQTSAELAAMKQYQKNAMKHVQYPVEYYRRHQERIAKININYYDKKKSKLPPKTVFPKETNQTIYPIEINGTTYDSYDLKIVYDRQKTGFEQLRDIKIVIDEVLAGRYQILAVLGQAQFSIAIQVKDLTTNKNYCIKIIQNNKDYFDQSLDEIKLLRYISANCNTDQCHLLTFHDFFYHKQHLMLVTQLLKDNLLDAYSLHPEHFTMRSIQNYSRQILIALDKLHSLHIIHTDLKPQNILIKSYSKQILKVIDMGCSIFFHDPQDSFNIQTISYRAPEVILGCTYDHKIDIWSFGCIIAELFTGKVLFESSSIVQILAKIQGMRGPWPSWMIEKGKQSYKYFTKDLVLFQYNNQQLQNSQRGILKQSNGMVKIFAPKNTNLKSRLNSDNKLFIDFISKCLKLDPSVRFSAKQALKHPFLSENFE